MKKKTNKKGINDRINEDKIRFTCHFRYFLLNSLQLFIDLSKVYSINHDLWPHFKPIFRWGSRCLIFTFTFTSSVCEQLFVFFDIALSCPSNYDFWLPRCVIALSCLITPLCHCIVLSDYSVVPLHCLVWLLLCYLQLFLLQVIREKNPSILDKKKAGILNLTVGNVLPPINIGAVVVVIVW